MQAFSSHHAVDGAFSVLTPVHVQCTVVAEVQVIGVFTLLEVGCHANRLIWLRLAGVTWAVTTMFVATALMIVAVIVETV
jgi:hypothetical protein